MKQGQLSGPTYHSGPFPLQSVGIVLALLCIVSQQDFGTTSTALHLRVARSLSDECAICGCMSKQGRNAGARESVEKLKAHL